MTEKELITEMLEYRPAIYTPPIAEGYTTEEFNEQWFDMLKCAIMYKSMGEKAFNGGPKTEGKGKNG